MKPDRVVLDTNVLISGLLSTTSVPAQATEYAITSGQLIASVDTLRELTSTLLSPRFAPYITQERREALLFRLAPLIEIVEVVQVVRACRDPADDKFLEAALNGRADVIVSGDRALLALHPFRGIALLAPAAYLDWRREQDAR